MSTTYNGWSNYNTWLVNLWFGDSDITDLRDYVEEHVDEIIGVERSGFLGDMIGSFMNDVNWDQLVEHYVEESRMDEEYVYPGDEVELTPEDVYSSVA